jgi:hypothetical protein
MKDRMSKKIHNAIIENIRSIANAKFWEWTERFHFCPLPLTMLQGWMLAEVFKRERIDPLYWAAFQDNADKVKLFTIEVLPHLCGSRVRLLCGNYESPLTDYLASEKAIQHSLYKAAGCPVDVLSLDLDELMHLMLTRVKSLNELRTMFVKPR